MKKFFLLLFLGLSFISSVTFAKVTDNPCLKNMGEHTQNSLLNLVSCQLNDDDIPFITHYINDNGITWLIIRNNLISDKGAIFLAKNTQLINLDISQNKIGSEGIIALAKRAIKSLKIGGVDWSNDAYTALIKSELTQLSIDHSKIDHEKILILNKATNITGLTLSDNNITIEDAAEISKNPYLVGIEIINNHLGDKGAIALAKAIANNKIFAVGLKNNEIGNDGALALAKNSQLTQYDLGYNPIGDKTAIGFANYSKSTRFLILCRNKAISATGVAALRKNKNIYFATEVGSSPGLTCKDYDLPNGGFTEPYL